MHSNLWNWWSDSKESFVMQVVEYQTCDPKVWVQYPANWNKIKDSGPLWVPNKSTQDTEKPSYCNKVSIILKQKHVNVHLHFHPARNSLTCLVYWPSNQWPHGDEIRCCPTFPSEDHPVRTHMTGTSFYTFGQVRWWFMETLSIVPHLDNTLPEEHPFLTIFEFFQLIFGCLFKPLPVGRSVNIRAILRYTGKFSM